MTQFLPPNLLAFFAPREPIPFLPPPTRLSHEKKSKGYSGVGQYLHLFEDPKDTPPPIKIETREERIERKKREKQEKAAYIREQGIALWDPHNNPNSTSDPYKTLFIARSNIDTTEAKLKKEFEVYGPIRKISMIFDKITQKPKGYTFVEYENEKDMHSAYKHGDGKKIDGRRVLVDVERGRTVKGWLPRRLGGGLSDNKSRGGREPEQEKTNYRERGNDRRGSDRDRVRNRSRSRERERRRRSKSRDRNERDRDRADRRSSGRDRDRSDRRERDRKDRHERYNENSGYEDGSISSSRRHRSRSRDRKRNVRSKSRSRSRERKRTRNDYSMDNGNNGSASIDPKDKYERHAPIPPPPPQYGGYDAGNESGEIEEGEDAGDYRRYGNNGNIKTEIKEEYDDDGYPDSYNQPAYVAYN